MGPRTSTGAWCQWRASRRTGASCRQHKRSACASISASPFRAGGALCGLDSRPRRGRPADCWTAPTSGYASEDVADDASCQVQELDATFISSAGFGYGATLEGGSTSYGFSAADAVDLGIEWNDRGEISASCDFTEEGEPYDDRRVQRLNLRRLLRRDAGEVGVVPVVGVPVGAKAMVGSLRCFFDDIMKEEFKDTMRGNSVPVPGDAAPATTGEPSADGAATRWGVDGRTRPRLTT